MILHGPWNNALYKFGLGPRARRWLHAPGPSEAPSSALPPDWATNMGVLVGVGRVRRPPGRNSPTLLTPWQNLLTYQSYTAQYSVCLGVVNTRSKHHSRDYVYQWVREVSTCSPSFGPSAVPGPDKSTGWKPFLLESGLETRSNSGTSLVYRSLQPTSRWVPGIYDVKKDGWTDGQLC
ncbi:hypothetical protein DFP72DRAFT_856523 [Ephemerocybe angulata]|uniref:Uncharacterized protein n=1 Tax=Ephemerocybe angulata TaxID=980116 RepID=A0A8H6HGI8_9AGAR|nr:hypothetical protein DFP72DRAFT_856523 [Tulosesus angulatus]